MNLKNVKKHTDEMKMIRRLASASNELINMLLAFEVLNDYIITEVHAINSMNKYTYHVQIQLCSKARLRTKLTQC